MGKRLALIIGNSVYQDPTLARLKAPDVDVGALHDVLKDSQVGGFDDVDLIFNSTSSNVRVAISSFFARKSHDDLLVLYFSGHGVLDDNGRLYLAVKDTDHSYLRATAIPAAFITDEMDHSRSRREVLILDCCHSGAFARGSKGATGASVGTASAFEGKGYGRVILTASDATQYAWEGDRVIGEAKNSLFTHYLVEGLQTGQADTNGDGEITVDELFDYVYKQVVSQTSKQTPGKWSYREQGEIVIARAHARVAPQVAEPKLPETEESVPGTPGPSEVIRPRYAKPTSYLRTAGLLSLGAAVIIVLLAIFAASMGIDLPFPWSRTTTDIPSGLPPGETAAPITTLTSWALSSQTPPSHTPIPPTGTTSPTPYGGGSGELVIQSGGGLLSLPADGSGAPAPLSFSAALGSLVADADFYTVKASPNGSRAAVWLRGGPGIGSITVIDDSGSQNFIATAISGALAWSPDGKRIAFVCRGTHPAGAVANPAICAVDADGTGQYYVLDDAAYGEITQIDSLAWSPDGSQIAFACDVDGDLEVYSLDSDGSSYAPRQVTHNDADDKDPAWSPDSARLAFVSNQGGGDFELYIINALGGNLSAPFTDNAVADCRPAWSPDGRRIAYISSCNITNEPRISTGDVYTLPSDGGGAHEFVTSGVDVQWTP
ncbi:MAG: caspase family protein [Anaerolineales bacterium]